MQFSVRLAETDSDLDNACSALTELRPHLAVHELRARINEQLEHGYRLALAESDRALVGVAGFVVGYKLAWGKHIYVDDLVTRERWRSRGVGSRLIEWLKTYAREQGCEQLHLGSGVQRFGAHRFYLRHGFDITSHHFSIGDLRN